MRCRICGTAKNLKYTPQQVRLHSKKGKGKLRLPLAALPSTSGNICNDCDERLQNFHKIENDIVSVDSDDNFSENKLPIIVDDDERLFELFYKRSIQKQQQEQQLHEDTPPIRSSNLGSDGDAEIIEVLTSRETTPDILRATDLITNGDANLTLIPPVITNVVDVIDLEDYDDMGKELSKEKPTRNASELRETHPLDCLNLLSSDTESEIIFEPCPQPDVHSKQCKTPPTSINNNQKKGVELKINKNCNNNNEDTVIIPHSYPVCKICGNRSIDTQTLEVHMREHESNKCSVCSVYFPSLLDLVSHMRQKHRSCDDNALCEGARCAQDSAMTIRLRFMQKHNFYECQLCGAIDSQFKMHKSHILEKHADEAKSLRDPITKSPNKCPLCQNSCGQQYVDVCRHLLLKHTSTEYNKCLVELTDISSLGLSAKNQQVIKQRACVLELENCKQPFFKCLLCQSIFGRTESFLKHCHGHNIDEWKQYKESKKDAKNDCLNNNNSTTSPAKLQPRVKRKRSELNEESMMSLNEESQPRKKKPKLESGVGGSSQKMATREKNNKKPKDIKSKSQDVVNRKTAPEIPTKPPTIPAHSKNQKKLKRKLIKDKKAEKKALKKGPTKVKVKPPLRHFPTQKYNCKYCQSIFKGFRKLNLHLLNTHQSEEFRKCDSCESVFLTEISLEEHKKLEKANDLLPKNKRKFMTSTATTTDTEELGHTDNKKVDENCNEDNGKRQKYRQNKNKTIQLIEETSEEHAEAIQPSLWLQELLQLSREKKNEEVANSTSTAIDDDKDLLVAALEHEELSHSANNVCSYCGLLFSSAQNLTAHSRNHFKEKDMPWVKFTITEKPHSSE